jgi:hypothetical protein
MEGTNASTEQEGKEHEKKIEVEVFAPRAPKDGKKFKWKPTLGTGEAAREAAEKFGYAPEGTPGFTKHKHVLDNTRTLEQNGVVDGDKLSLVDAGGGV